VNFTPAAPPEIACGSQHCITCGDDGDPMTVMVVDSRHSIALCRRADGTRTTVETALVEPVARGDRLLVHAGTAIVLLTERDGAQ
jgi:hydrogenase maturation factor